MYLKLVQSLQFINRICAKRTVCINADHHVVRRESLSNRLENCQLLIKFYRANFHFDAPKSLLNFFFHLIDHEGGIAHPNQAVDGNMIISQGKFIVE